MSGWVSSTGWNINLASPGPIGNVTPSTAAFTTLTASNNVTLSGGTANGVVYLNGSKVATSGSVLVFDGTNLGIGTSSPSNTLSVHGVSTNDGGAYWNTYIRNNTTAATSAGKTGIAFSAFYSGTSSYANFSGIFGGKENATDGNDAGALYFWTKPLSGAPAVRASIDSTGNFNSLGVVSTAGYTVATLPTGIATGSRAYVTDALTPVVLTAVTGGGAVVVPVFYDGTNWIVG